MGVSSGTSKIIGRIVGIVGLLCYFLTFAKFSIFGISDSLSGFGILKEIFSGQGGIDPHDKPILIWLILSFAGGLVGVICSFALSGSLVGGISDVFGAISLFFLKDAIESYGFNMGTGWTLAMICFILAAICAFVTLNLERKEAVQKQTQRETKSRETNDDEEFKKLRDELAKFRVYDDDKKK